MPEWVRWLVIHRRSGLISGLERACSIKEVVLIQLKRLQKNICFSAPLRCALAFGRAELSIFKNLAAQVSSYAGAEAQSIKTHLSAPVNSCPDTTQKDCAVVQFGIYGLRSTVWYGSTNTWVTFAGASRRKLLSSPSAKTRPRKTGS